MAKQIRYFFFFLPITIGIVFMVSCKKKTPEDIGLPILPGDDLLNALFTDTATLITHTVMDDSLKTDEAALMLLGNINDPVFGITKASVFTQLSLSTTNPVFGTNPILDSAVLSLVYNKVQYGTLYPQKFNVYEVTEALHLDSTYYSNRMMQYATELASVYITPAPNPATDSVIIDTVKYPPHLRISLDKNFFQNFLDNTSFYSSDASLQSFFKGLYIASSSGSPLGEGAILYMDLAHINSRLTLFYHNTTDTTSYYFDIPKDGCARFSHFEHDYSLTTDIQNQLNTPSNIQEDKVFVQPMAGVRTKITLPYIQGFFNHGKVAINKAELILPVDPTSLIGVDSIFYPSAKLVATIADSVLGPAIMPDYFESAFGGDYDAVNKVYKFNIARHIQQVLNGTKKNQGLYIITNARPTTTNRVQLIGGNKALTNRMRLRITYTPLE